MKYEHLPEDLLIDYKVDKDKNKLDNKYKNKDKKIRDSFSLQDLLTEDQIEKLINYKGGSDAK